MIITTHSPDEPFLTGLVYTAKVRLAAFLPQFKVIELNNDQVVKHLKATFREKQLLHCRFNWKKRR
jgi:hypothetical protein